MARRLLICTEFSPEELRAKSRLVDDRRCGMRMLAIANAIEGMSRREAARLADMSDQALVDAIKRYNGEGIDGLYDRPRPGRPSKLTDAQREELRDLVIEGPDIEAEGTSAWTREDLCRIARKKWGIDYAVTSMGRTLRALKLSRQKTRPSHPKKNPEAAEAFKKGSGRSAENRQ